MKEAKQPIFVTAEFCWPMAVAEVYGPKLVSKPFEVLHHVRKGVCLSFLAHIGCFVAPQELHCFESTFAPKDWETVS